MWISKEKADKTYDDNSKNHDFNNWCDFQCSDDVVNLLLLLYRFVLC
jgi:hypothetical protein